jgi:hypothetical protein
MGQSMDTKKKNGHQKVSFEGNSSKFGPLKKHVCDIV